ncbi:hypothetical protein NDU88_002245 [Pleurodeles waltl]|uniref:Uncharacterized protein n=1 Tax=Pleurodeles waltl TaxID=8319 RepID=A0AAV7TMJ6_PLEWA|nr:hypothetical protein NDU88_002245 [Pleurodeles waltl]
MAPKLSGTQMTGFPYPYLDNRRKRTRSPYLGTRISWFPYGIETKNRLRMHGALGKEDAKEEGAEHGGGAEKRADHAQEEEQKEASPGDNPKGLEDPEEPERRHVPGGTWLSQVRSYLKDSFRLMKGREEAVGGEEGGGEGRGKGDKKGRGKDFKRGP